ncbi:alpha/beta hydrolase [Companilactobacillus suantsaicola]|uniref:Alpha/beta hydrolase n=1 Tax=Companilactobacillus suantsaicola TaxID=2487723 RepID=A0A4Z0JJI5_9LACO|nr:alpha/beta fold hydrolase [Companilactobacillus suantsaicola]TGD23064.1 alpha/beta hydrolase [Companilactobacillus suantsaicola]
MTTEIKHWSNYKYSENMLQDALIKHVMDLMPYKMSDEGEVLEVTMNLIENDENSWINNWSLMAERLQKRAEDFEGQDKLVSAASSYLRASTYWRVSLMYFKDTNDIRMKKFSKNSQVCFDKALQYGAYPGKAIQIPYENTTLPGHFYRSTTATKNAPLLIVVPGRDTWADDTMWVIDGALKRGINALTFDGPGQGMALRLQNLKFRPDFENVLTPVIDFAKKIDGIDSSRISAMGMSFGGFLVPRAAAFDNRLKVIISDPGNMNWGNMIAQRLKIALKMSDQVRPSMIDFTLKDYEWKHNADDNTIIDELKKYDNTAIVNQIKSKTLVLDGSAEVTHGAAQKFYDALQCPKDYLLFDDESTAQQHTQMGGYLTGTVYIMNWIEDNL